ncbi:hypothetical protein PINS_up023918 [Pythium insidiosum]|nr:hypothetical protein PINS_up023918 [Pythium insidiosum]
MKRLPNDASLATATRAVLESELTYVGLAAFADELRPEAPRVLATLHNAGLVNRVLTGDAPLAVVRVLRAIPFLLRAPRVSIIDFVDDDVRYLERPLELELELKVDDSNGSDKDNDASGNDGKPSAVGTAVRPEDGDAGAAGRVVALGVTGAGHGQVACWRSTT